MTSIGRTYDPSLLLRLALALCGGVVLSLAFAPLEWGWAAIPAVCLVVLSAWNARAWPALACGLVAGLAFFLPLMHWMTVIGNDAWIGLSAFCSAWFALMALAMAAFSRLPGAPLLIASVWMLQEALRGRVPWGGFPWGDLGFSAPGQPWSHALAWLGTAGTGSLLALAGACLAAGVVAWREGKRVWTWPVAGMVLLALFSALPLPTVGSEGTRSVAVVQGGTPQLGMGAMDVRREVLNNHVAQTIALADAVDAGSERQPDLVVWPENSTDIDPLVDKAAAAAISSAARAIQAPILVGAVMNADDPFGRDGVWNTGLLWLPTGLPGALYVKNHPVPFGEYIPFREQVASLIGRFDRIPRDFLAGSAPGVIEVDGMVIGDVICFEVAYSDVIDAVIDGGAQLLTVQTNNATYGGSYQPEQQLQITRARAIEQGRYAAVAATTGVSAVIGPNGQLEADLQQGQVGWLVREVTLSSSQTPAATWGRPLEALGCAVAVLALAWATVVGWRKRRSHTL